MQGGGKPPPLARKLETERDRNDARTDDGECDATACKQPAPFALAATGRLARIGEDCYTLSPTGLRDAAGESLFGPASASRLARRCAASCLSSLCLFATSATRAACLSSEPVRWTVGPVETLTLFLRAITNLRSCARSSLMNASRQPGSRERDSHRLGQ